MSKKRRFSIPPSDSRAKEITAFEIKSPNGHNLFLYKTDSPFPSARQVAAVKMFMRREINDRK